MPERTADVISLERKKAAERLEIHPVRDWIWLKERPRREKEDLIQVPDNASSPRLAKWEVVAVGPGTPLPGGEFIPVSVKAGDHIAAQPAFAATLAIDGQNYALIQDEGIMAVITGDYGKHGSKLEDGQGFS